MNKKYTHNISTGGKVALFVILFLTGGVIFAGAAGFVSYEPWDDTFILWDTLKIGPGGAVFGTSELGDVIGDGNLYIEQHEVFVGDSVAFCDDYTATSSIDDTNCSSIVGPQDGNTFLNTGILQNDSGIQLETSGSGVLRLRTDPQQIIDIDGRILGGGVVTVGSVNQGGGVSSQSVSTSTIFSQGGTIVIGAPGDTVLVDADAFDIGNSFSRILLNINE